MLVVVQLVITAVILTMTVLVFIAAINVFQIFKEFRLTLKRVNKILDNTAVLSETTVKPVMAVNSFFSEVKDLVKQTEDEMIEGVPDRIITAAKSEETTRRKFFYRAGLPLRPS